MTDDSSGEESDATDGSGGGGGGDPVDGGSDTVDRPTINPPDDEPDEVGSPIENEGGADSREESNLAHTTLAQIETWGDERVAPSIGPLLGVLVAGGALVALLSPGPGTDAMVSGYPAALVVRAAAALVLLAFALDRQGLLDRRIAGSAAVLGGLVVAVGEVFRAIDALTVWPQPGGVPVAGLLALVVVAVGVAEVRELSNGRFLRAAAGVFAAGAIGTVGFLVGNVLAALLAGGLAEAGVADSFGRVYIALTIGLALALVGYAWLVVHRVLGGDVSFFDLAMPSLRDLGIAVLGFLALLTMSTVIGIAIQEFGVPMAASQIERQAEETASATWVLYLVPLSFLAIAPGEELLYRNVVQKYLYGAMSRWGAVIAGAGLFAGMHFFQYLSATPGATLVSLTTVFTLALVLGASYERTDNIVVPILIHGAFNALAFVGMYVRVTGGVPGG